MLINVTTLTHTSVHLSKWSDSHAEVLVMTIMSGIRVVEYMVGGLTAIVLVLDLIYKTHPSI